jgi:hypothetical protein
LQRQTWSVDLVGVCIGLNGEKVHLAKGEITFLGQSLSAEGVKVLAERVAAIREYPPPKNLRQCADFLGVAGFYAQFVKEFSSIAEPLHALKRKGAKFPEGPSQQEGNEPFPAHGCNIMNKNKDNT